MARGSIHLRIYFALVSNYKRAGLEQIRAAFVHDGFGSLSSRRVR